MIQIDSENLLTLAQAAALVPSSRSKAGTAKPHTLARWITHGYYGIRLEAIRLGGSWFTTAEAIQRFSEALTADQLKDRERPFNATASHLAAEAELQAMGWGDEPKPRRQKGGKKAQS